MVFLEPAHPIFLSYVLPLTTLAGVLISGMLLVTGGLYPDRKLQTVFADGIRGSSRNRHLRIAGHADALIVDAFCE